MGTRRHLPEPISGSARAIQGQRLGQSDFSELSLPARTLRPFWATLRPLERSVGAPCGKGDFCVHRGPNRVSRRLACRRGAPLVPPPPAPGASPISSLLGPVLFPCLDPVRPPRRPPALSQTGKPAGKQVQRWRQPGRGGSLSTPGRSRAGRRGLIQMGWICNNNA